VADDGPGACGLRPARLSEGSVPWRICFTAGPGRLSGRPGADHDRQAAGAGDRRRVSGRTFSAHVISFATRIGGDQPASAAVATAVLVFLFVVRARWPQLPGLLLAMRLASGAVAAGRPNDHGKAVVGQIPAGLLLALGLLAAFSDDVL